MKIQLDPKDWPDVYDHPEYCNEWEGKKCKFHEQLYASPPYCVLFGPLNGNNTHDFKASACKLAYMNAKNMELEKSNEKPESKLAGKFEYSG